MPKLTDIQIAAVARSAGFGAEHVGIAVAVALAESGGNTSAHNAKPPDDSYGLWQINMLGKLGPDRRARFGLTDNNELYNPFTNAKAAKAIHAGSGWNAWTTYKRLTAAQKAQGKAAAFAVHNPLNGKVNYELAIASVRAMNFADATVKSGNGGTGEGLAGALPGLPSIDIAGPVNALNDNAMKIGQNMIGIAIVALLFILGVVILLRNQIGNVLPAKKILKAVGK